MKKRALLFTAVAAIGYFTLTSYQTGPAGSGQNRSGALGSATSCGDVGCHGGTSAATSVSITVDSGTVPVTKYVAGHTYTIKIAGGNTSSLPKFGFQYAVVSGTGAAQVQAGSCSSLPTNVASHSLSGLNFIEHSSPLTGTGGTYAVSFQWTAPAAGTGTVTMYCTLNAVNGNGLNDNTDVSNNTSKTLTEETAAPPTSVASVTADLGILAYPNPMTNTLNLQISNAQAGNYTIQVFDLNGRCITSGNITAAQTASINTVGWAPGVYNVVIANNSGRQVVPVVKK